MLVLAAADAVDATPAGVKPGVPGPLVLVEC